MGDGTRTPVLGSVRAFPADAFVPSLFSALNTSIKTRSSDRDVLLLTRLSSGGFGIHQIYECQTGHDATPFDEPNDDSGIQADGSRPENPPLLLVMGIDHGEGSHYNPAVQVFLDAIENDTSVLSAGADGSLERPGKKAQAVLGLHTLGIQSGGEKTGCSSGNANGTGAARPVVGGAVSGVIVEQAGVARGRGVVCRGRKAGGAVSGNRRIVAAQGRGADGAYCGGGGVGRDSLVHSSARSKANKWRKVSLEAVKDAEEAEEAVKLVQAFEAAEAEEAEKAVRLVQAFEAVTAAETAEALEEETTANVAKKSSPIEREQLMADVLCLLTGNACFGFAELVAKRVAQVPKDGDVHALLQDKDLLENVVYQTMCSAQRELKSKGNVTTLTRLPPPSRHMECSIVLLDQRSIVSSDSTI